VNIEDAGLVRYANLEPIVLPHVSARYANKKFGKSKVNVVERLINNMMRTEKYSGKKFKAYNVVKDAFDIIARRTKQNPIQILIEALENCSPKEEVVRLRFGGILVPKAVDSSPSRRLDFSLRNISKGAVKSSHKNKKNVATCLADELIMAAKKDMNSFAINKKEDMERVAASAR
jgi:small subunit ribosomal protein S7